MVRNNLSTGLELPDSGVTSDHNIVISEDDYAAWFVNADSFNYRPLAECRAIDPGSSAGPFPTVDIEGIRRPQGETVDIGAYEYR